MEGFGYSLFDDEGTPTEALELIKDGTLISLVHNSMTASLRIGIYRTRNTRPRSTLGVGLHQLAIKAGDGDEKELYSGKYLLITDLTGMHSGANAISGEFSFGASGYLCENSERLKPVRNITVAGNFMKCYKPSA